jgi:hypothetical protein
MQLKTMRNAFTAAAFLGLGFTGLCLHNVETAINLARNNLELSSQNFEMARQDIHKWLRLSVAGLAFASVATAGSFLCLLRDKQVKVTSVSNLNKPSI